MGIYTEDTEDTECAECAEGAEKTGVRGGESLQLAAKSAGARTVLLLRFPNDMQLHFFAVDVENVGVPALDGDFRYRIYGNIARVAIGVRAR
jgi:hypothetical protein